jgi:hypothetical protein
MTRLIANELKQIAYAKEPAPPESLLRRALRRLRLARRPKMDIEQAAVETRAERLFEVNFRTTWTR